MRYELLLQSAEPGQPYDAERVEAALTARPVATTQDGRVWRFSAGEVEVRPLVEQGRVVATELRVPLTEKTDLVRALVQEASALAAETNTRLVDPQLSREVGPQEAEIIAEQYLRTARYAGEMVGVSSALGAFDTTPGPGGAITPGMKVLLVIVAGVVVLMLLSELLLP